MGVLKKYRYNNVTSLINGTSEHLKKALDKDTSVSGEITVTFSATPAR